MRNDMPSQIIMGGNVGRGHGTEVNRGGRLVPGETPEADTMPGVWDGTHRGYHESTPPPDEQDQARNRLESADIQTDSTPTPGVRSEIYADNKVVSLPLPRMPEILLCMERPTLSFQ